jgi:transcriptional regulator with XRE-family HTH domain
VTIKERIALALERSDNSQRDLAKLMGLSSPTVSSMLAKDEIDSMRYLKAVEELTGFRFEWLRTGIGPEKVGDEKINIEPHSEIYWQEKLKSKDELIEELRGRIGDMKKIQEMLEKQLKGKKG